ncbi:hypothetical protein E2C01_077989 [Portunus trituberculatus]|uniref:Uncharacterized protein n=1 Tax=Portunus trituberculatus TaxID=210409 RepID=A0A5B7IHK0_PORTR|nr:hypothetical protein [Portunus trituberculatus]
MCLAWRWIKAVLSRISSDSLLPTEHTPHSLSSQQIPHSSLSRSRLSALNLLSSHLVYSELCLPLLLSPCSVYSIFQQPSGECDPSHVPLLAPQPPLPLLVKDHRQTISSAAPPTLHKEEIFQSYQLAEMYQYQTLRGSHSNISAM